MTLAAVIVVESSRTMPEFRGAPPQSDKVVHFLLFGLLATLLARSGAAVGWRHRTLWLVAAVSLFGATDEWHQSFTPGRSCDIVDWAADTVGAVLAVVAYQHWPAYRSLLEKPLFCRRPAPAVVAVPEPVKP